MFALSVVFKANFCEKLFLCVKTKAISHFAVKLVARTSRSFLVYMKSGMQYPDLLVGLETQDPEPWRQDPRHGTWNASHRRDLGSETPSISGTQDPVIVGCEPKFLENFLHFLWNRVIMNELNCFMSLYLFRIFFVILFYRMDSFKLLSS